MKKMCSKKVINEINDEDLIGIDAERNSRELWPQEVDRNML